MHHSVLLMELPGPTAMIAELASYPVKGCASVPLGEAVLTEAGLAHDRTFMVIDANGVFRTQRRDPLLAAVQPGVTADGGQLTLRTAGMEDLHVEVDLAAARRDVLLFGDRLQGIDQGEAAAQWLSSVLGRPSRLVRVPPEQRRAVDGWARGTSAYADSSPVHVISRATLEGLNKRLAGTPVPMSRFRPNIVIDGWENPHTEDRARHVRLGDAELGYAKLAIRCAVTLVDQDTGVRAGPEPIRTLATYRRALGGGVALGAKFSVLQVGKLTVGDRVTVHSWGESEL